MKIEQHEPNELLVATFRGCDFQLERDGVDDIFPGRWYMIVTTPDGGVLCDGWIDDSEAFDERQAMAEACKGALLEPPKRWPRQPRKNRRNEL